MEQLGKPKSKYYDYIDNKQCDIQSIIHCINLQGKDLVGVEVGVFFAKSFCTLLQNCPNIKLLYGIDRYEPYTDYLIENYDMKNVDAIYDEKQIESIKLSAYHSIKFSGHKDKAKIIEEDHKEASKKFDDESLDFVFVDNYTNHKEIIDSLETWYPKVKKGGLFAGHDTHLNVVKLGIAEFRERNKIDNTISFFDKTFIWRK